MENGSRTPSTVVIVFLIYFLVCSPKRRCQQRNTLHPERCDERRIQKLADLAQEKRQKPLAALRIKEKENKKKMTFDILLVNSLSASTVTSYDKRIEQRGRAGAVRGDHRSFPRTFIIMARRCRQEPRPPSPLSRETVFSMRLSEHFRVHLKLQRISAFSRKKNKTRKTKEKKKKKKTPRNS